MGRNNKRRRNRERKEIQEDAAQRIGPGYKDIIKENPAFETYYKAQGVIPEGEWEQFMDKIKENLPATFRITGYKRQAKALLNIIQGQYFNNLLKVHIEGEVIEKPLCLPWYPDNLAWQLNLSRVIIRKSVELAKLHNFLVSETASGNISRQETVSMIPPLLLDVQSHHKVLDICAAPGSKTSQIIEMLHKDEGKIPEGVVVANDVDNKRCYMLVHQAKRLHSPCFIVTNHDASNLPNFRIKKDDAYEIMKFDRVLCDVPCSGDGTIRKNIDVWNKWNVGNGNNLYGVQIRIITRGLELLAEGGRLVYSTCSMNPVEDEAVISTILQKSKGTVELVDVSKSLTGLKATKGVYTWKVMSRNLNLYDKFEDVPEVFSTQIRPQMFPPTLEEAKAFKLERCLRILPHHQDTGGFFVAVLQKKCDLLPWETAPSKTPLYLCPETPDEAKDTNSEAKDGNSERTRSPPRKKKRVFGFKEDPYIFLQEDDEALLKIKGFFETEPNFPTNQLLCRCLTGRNRNLYFVSSSAKDLIEANSDRLKIINTGVRLYCRCDNKDAKCIYRICQEGMLVILPFLKNRRLNVCKEDLILLLSEEYPDINKFTKCVQDQIKVSDPGCVVLMYSTKSDDSENELEIVLCGWQGKSSLRCYVPKIERIHYLRLAGVDVTELEMREKKFKQEKDNKRSLVIKTEGDDSSEENENKSLVIKTEDGEDDSLDENDSKT